MEKNKLVIFIILFSFCSSVFGVSCIDKEKELIDFAIVGNHPSFLTQNNISCNYLSYVPRVYLGGYAGNDLLGQADILAPLMLRNDRNFFAYGQGRYAHEKQNWEQDTWTGSLGLGYRQIVANTTVLGAYVFGDYSKSTSGHKFFIISPGIESLGRIWEFRANSYFPLNKKRWVDQGWADQFGDYKYVRFEGHTQFDHWYQYYLETGIGADAEVGRKLFTIKNTLVKGYINGYYYNLQHNDDVYGGGAKITIQPNSYLEFSLNDSYDNYAHNIFMAGIRVSLYDLFSKENKILDDQDLQQKLFVPIERNFGSLGSGSSIPVTRSDNPEDKGEAVETNNIWFFRAANNAAFENAPPSTTGDGTYEHPFSGTDFNQTTVNWLRDNAPGALMYFSSGSYNSMNGANPMQIYYSQSMWGRTADYTAPASGNTRALFTGGLLLNVGNNTLDSIRLHNDGNQSEGIKINGANNVTMNNIAVGTQGAPGSYTTGILLNNSTNINLNNSQIYSYGAGRLDPVTFKGAISGVNIIHSTLNLGSNNTIFAYSMAAATTDAGEVFVAEGISFTNNSELDINGDDNNIAAFGNITNAGGYVSVESVVNGISDFANLLSSDSSKINISGKGNTISAINFSINIDDIAANGIFHFGSTNPLNIAAINISGVKNTINATTIANTSDAEATGIGDFYAVRINISDAVINVDGSPLSSKIGIEVNNAFNAAALHVNATTFNILGGTNGDDWGIYSTAGGFSPAQIAQLKDDNTFNGVDDAHEVGQ